MKKFILLFICNAAIQMLSAQSSGTTAFNPEIHGFKFENSFKNALPFDIRTGGLCGGMVYSALDYYYKRMKIPEQDYRPADKTTLQSYIYSRQLNSITPNLDKWAEVGTNPGGARNNEFFEWGLKGFGGGRIQELKEFIDKGKPVVLGMQGAGGPNDGGGHQILAIGYEMGRYRGDLGAYKEDFKIKVYDPNYPDKIMTLVPDLNKKVYYYSNLDKRKEWRTYFVDKKYTLKQPPSIPAKNYPKDGKVYELVLEFATGGDDLRGGNDNVNLSVNQFEGPAQVLPAVNLRANWQKNYSQFVCVPLRNPVEAKYLKSIDLVTTFGGGTGGDNWDLKYLNVWARGGNVNQLLYDSKRAKGDFLNRFTGDRKSYTVVLNNNPPFTNDDKIRSLSFIFLTGSDDLRGGNDNLNISIYYSDGSKQDVVNVNHGAKWKDNSKNVVTVQLNKAVKKEQIRQIILTTTFRGGSGGDNWNLNKLEISGLQGTVNRTFYSRSGNYLNRFTGDKRTFTVTF